MAHVVTWGQFVQDTDHPDNLAHNIICGFSSV
jgi:hypothetical protein